MKARFWLAGSVTLTSTSLVGLITSTMKAAPVATATVGETLSLYIFAISFIGWLFTAIFQLLRAHAEYTARLLNERSYRR